MDENKEKIEVFLTRELKETIRKEAKSHGITMSEVVKRALSTYFK